MTQAKSPPGHMNETMKLINCHVRCALRAYCVFSCDLTHSVDNTRSIISFLSFSHVGLGSPPRQFKSWLRSRFHAAARWWFSMGDLSLYRTASSSCELTR